MHREHHRAHFIRCGAAPLLRTSLATAVAVLGCTALGACNRNGTETEKTAATTAAAPGEQPRADERPGELGRAGEPQVQPTPQQQPTTAPPTGTTEREEVMARQDVMGTRAQQACPMVVDGSSVEIEDTADGVALRFTTTTAGNVDDLRTRVEHLSRMYGTERGKGAMMWQHMGHKRAEGDRPGMGMGMGPGPGGAMPAATAKVENIDNGARLVLTPSDSGQLTALREHLRHHQQRMSGGECWWMQEGAAGEGAQG